jgi:hypothetical protein
MGKVTIEFDTIEEEEELRNALNGYKWKAAMWELDQKLRNTTKYGTSILDDKESASKEEQDIVEKIRDLIVEIVLEYNLQM